MTPSRGAVVALIAILLAGGRAEAHPLNPALLELHEGSDGTCDVAWRVPIGAPVNAPLSPVLPETCRPVWSPTKEVVAGGQSVVSRWRVDCRPGGLVDREVGVSGLDQRRTEALVRVELADGRHLENVLRGSRPSFVVRVKSAPAAVILTYVEFGFRHILGGPDHLLFVLGLLLLLWPNRRLLLWTLTAFTAGHSVTLSLAALGVVHVPPRPAEGLIALTLFVLALQLARERQPLGVASPWAMAFVFGLLHGLGFAGALSQIGLPDDRIPLALASFNVGIELGQIAFVIAAVVALATVGALLGKTQAPRWAAKLPAYGIGAVSVLWILERAQWGP